MRTRSLAQSNYIMTADYDSLPPHEQLIRACFEVDCEWIQVALDAGADVDYRYKQPIRIASAHGHIDAIRLLLRRGANIKTRRMHEPIVLSEAIEANQIEAVTLLVAAGARVNDGGEAVCIAAESGHRDMLQLLVDLGASAKHNHNYPIQRAARHCDSKAVELLLGVGAYLKDFQKYCPAVMAVVERHILKKRYARQAREEYEGIGL